MPSPSGGEMSLETRFHGQSDTNDGTFEEGRDNAGSEGESGSEDNDGDDGNGGESGNGGDSGDGGDEG